MVDFGIFASGDAHLMFGTRAGFAIWLPEVAKFFNELGLDFPLEIPPKYPHPSKSDFAELTDSHALPASPAMQAHIRGAYEKFLKEPLPRAFALSLDGAHYSLVSVNPLASDRAMDDCQGVAHMPCRFYAIDNDVVWQAQ